MLCGLLHDRDQHPAVIGRGGFTHATPAEHGDNHHDRRRPQPQRRYVPGVDVHAQQPRRRPSMNITRVLEPEPLILASDSPPD